MIDKASFFRLRYEELRKDSQYADITNSEVKQLLEAEYRQALAKAEADYRARERAEAERQARERAEAERQAKEREKIAKEFHERVVKAHAAFNAPDKEMARATTRKNYKNHCWHCLESISSATNAQCPVCEYFICDRCGACFCGILNH